MGLQIMPPTFLTNRKSSRQGRKEMREDYPSPQEERRGQSLMNRRLVRCDRQHCGRPAGGVLEFQALCIDHFIAFCYDRLSACSGKALGELDVETTQSLDRFLEGCSEQAAALTRNAGGLDNLDRARLFDIMLWASEIIAKRSTFRPRQLHATGG